MANTIKPTRFYSRKSLTKDICFYIMDRFSELAEEYEVEI